MKLQSLLLLFLSLHCTSNSYSAEVDFEKEILPILAANCFECHSNAVKKPKGDLRFDSAVALKEVADGIEWSGVLELVKLPAGNDALMPPADKGGPLAKEEIALLERWINEGAKVGNFVAYEHKQAKQVSGLGQKPVATELKAAAAAIDRIVEAGLKSRGLQRNAVIDDASFLRRVFLELAGRNPTIGEAEQFLQTSDPDKRSLLVQRLLKSDAYVSRHFNYWAKVLRAQLDQQGNEQDAWMHYLKSAIANNIHYNQWTRDMLTAEGRLWDNPAIGFYLRDAKNRLAGYEAMTSVFLGTDIGCTQCHDHPTRPLTQLAYYKMNGYYESSHPFGEGSSMFANIGAGEYKESLSKRQKFVKDNKLTRRDRESQIVTLGFISTYKFRVRVTAEDNTGRSKVPESYRYNDVQHNAHLEPEPIFGIPPALKKGDKPMRVFAQWVTDPQNLKFTHVIANRMWLKVMGAPVLGSPTDIVALSESKFPELAEYLAELMLACDYDLQKFQAILMNTRTFQAEAVAEEKIGADFGFQGPVFKRLAAEQLWDSLLTLIQDKVDPPATGPAPNFDFYLAARDVKKADEYWKLVEKRLDYELEHKVGIIGGFGDEIRSNLKTSRQGFDSSFLVRASELPSPAPDGHYLQVFGQGQRINIEDQWDTATIPQALMMLNGNLHDEISRPDSALSKTLGDMSDPRATIRKIYLASLARYPDSAELALAHKVTADKSRASYLKLLWILLNTTEFAMQP